MPKENGMFFANPDFQNFVNARVYQAALQENATKTIYE